MGQRFALSAAADLYADSGARVVTQGEGTRGIGYGGAARPSMGFLHHGLLVRGALSPLKHATATPAVGACDVNAVRQLLMRGGMA
jgi:hypothetical protein